MGDGQKNDSRDESGRWSQQFSDAEFLDAVASLPVASSQRVAEEVGCSYDLAYRRLKRLEEDGRVESRNVGGSYVWLVADE